MEVKAQCGGSPDNESMISLLCAQCAETSLSAVQSQGDSIPEYGEPTDTQQV